MNFEGETEPSITFRRAFAISCNTAFIGLAQKLPDDALATAAPRFGFGTTPDVGLAAKGGTFPAPGGDTERAAAAIGQGRVTASPLAMAGVAGTVAVGTWHAPSLIVDPAPKPAPAATPLDPTGRGEPLVPDARGRAERHGDRGGDRRSGHRRQDRDRRVRHRHTPKTHAWFIGFRGDLAFAVIVEGGGVGGRVAAPIAHTFLAAG